MKFLAAPLALHVMSRTQLRELMVLFVVGSALTLAVFFLALWLMPEQPFTPFFCRDFLEPALVADDTLSAVASTNQPTSLADPTVSVPGPIAGAGLPSLSWRAVACSPGGDAANRVNRRLKTRLTPSFFPSYRCRSRASNRACFALVFDAPLCVTAPSRYA